MDFATLVAKTRESKGLPELSPNLKVAAFDPGHTTGWAVFNGAKLIQRGQLNTGNIPRAAGSFMGIFQNFNPNVIVMEDYRVYAWRKEQHVGSEMLTTRVIGCIETVCALEGIFDIIKQPAHIGKGFCTNKKLKDWGFYSTGEKHAMDAVRHGTHYLLFGPIQKKDKKGHTVG